MYICLCNAITDRDVKQHGREGCSVAMVYRALGVEPQCGKCVPLVRQMLRLGGAGGAPLRAELAGGDD